MKYGMLGDLYKSLSVYHGQSTVKNKLFLLW